jgi:hypothetical protein
MADKKILILAMPRTGTTIMQRVLAKDVFAAENLSEPFNRFIVKTNPTQVYPSDADPYKWAAEQSSGIMKLLSIVLDHFDFEKLMSVAKFDRVVLVERNNLLDGCLSLKYAELTNKYHRYQGEHMVQQQFTVTPFDLELWHRSYKLYNEAKQFVIGSGIPYDIVNYDDFIAGVPQYVAGKLLQSTDAYDTVPNNVNYRELCTNWHEVETYIRNKTC